MPTSESELLASAVAGDRGALEKLLVAHAPSLSRHLAFRIPRKLQDTISNDDVLQQTFLHAFRGIAQFSGTSERSFGAWLKTIADHQLQNAIASHNRKKRGGDMRRVREEGDAAQESWQDLLVQVSAHQETPSKSVARHEVMSALQVAVAGLATDQQQAVRFYYLEGRSLEETANLIGRSPTAVRGLIYRAKQRIAEVLDRASKWM